MPSNLFKAFWPGFLLWHFCAGFENRSSKSFTHLSCVCVRRHACVFYDKIHTAFGWFKSLHTHTRTTHETHHGWFTAKISRIFRNRFTMLRHPHRPPMACLRQCSRSSHSAIITIGDSITEYAPARKLSLSLVPAQFNRTLVHKTSSITSCNPCSNLLRSPCLLACPIGTALTYLSGETCTISISSPLKAV